MADLSPIELATFWSRVEVSTPAQCWPWKGPRTPQGYGRFQRTPAHRLAHELVNGPIPDGLLVRHTCDNRPCCNPRHLLTGTHKDNTRDAIERDRFAIGQRHGNTKLTPEQVAHIRGDHGRRSGAALARKYGISRSTVCYIRSGRSWKLVGLGGIEPPTPAVSKQCSTNELQAQPVQRTSGGSVSTCDDNSNSKGSVRCQRSGPCRT